MAAVIRQVPLTSGHLKSAGYDRETKVLEVYFRKSPRVFYRYFGVPPEVFAELMAAESASAYFREHVMEKFAMAKMPDPVDGGEQVSA